MKLFNYFQNKTIKNCDEAVSISDFLRRELEKETGIKGSVKYIKIDEKRFNKNIKSDIKNKLNIKGPMLLYVGRISPHKGIHLLIGAFKLIKKQIPNAKLIIIPGIAFDKNGHRLGFGESYFDRLLKKTKIKKIGLAYEFQIIDEIPKEVHDVPVDIIVTENQIINVS